MNNKVNYLSQTYLINQKIINYFKLIESCVNSNLSFLKNIFLNCNINVNNNKVFIEINQKIIELIDDNKKFFSLLNFLKFNYLNIENVFIKKLFQ